LTRIGCVGSGLCRIESCEDTLRYAKIRQDTPRTEEYTECTCKRVSMEPVATLHATRHYPHSVGISLSQMRYLYKIVATRPPGVFDWIHSRVSNEVACSRSHCETRWPRRAKPLDSFLDDLIVALHHHQGRSQIEYDTLDGVDEMESGPLGRVLGLNTDCYPSKIDFTRLHATLALRLA
jgi:hypothetical protein